MNRTVGTQTSSYSVSCDLNRFQIHSIDALVVATQLSADVVEEEGASIEEDVLSEGEAPCQVVVLFWVDSEAEPDDH